MAKHINNLLSEGIVTYWPALSISALREHLRTSPFSEMVQLLREVLTNNRPGATMLAFEDGIAQILLIRPCGQLWYLEFGKAEFGMCVKTCNPDLPFLNVGCVVFTVNDTTTNLDMMAEIRGKGIIILHVCNISSPSLSSLPASSDDPWLLSLPVDVPLVTDAGIPHAMESPIPCSSNDPWCWWESSSDLLLTVVEDIPGAMDPSLACLHPSSSCLPASADHPASFPECPPSPSVALPTIVESTNEIPLSTNLSDLERVKLCAQPLLCPFCTSKDGHHAYASLEGKGWSAGEWAVWHARKSHPAHFEQCLVLLRMQIDHPDDWFALISDCKRCAGWVRLHGLQNSS